MLRLSETPRSMSSLSPRSSLSSLSPPCSPLISDTNFLSGQTFPAPVEPGVLGLDIHSRLAELELNMNCEEEPLQKEQDEKQNHRNLLREEVKGQKRINFLLSVLQLVSKSRVERVRACVYVCELNAISET